MTEKRLIGLDLLRALAILGVLIVHLSPTWRQVGLPRWVLQLFAHGGSGVDLFFALSGFLIGTLLLEIVERDASLSTWGRFMIRRWMRTVPLYLLWIMTLLFVLPPKDIDAVPHFLLFSQNLAWPMPAWFPVSWSLTVEEWFYLLFSGMLLLLIAAGVRHAILITLATFLIVPLVVGVVFGPFPNGWDAGFRKIVVFRMDAIAYGVVAACVYRYRHEAAVHWQHALLFGGLAIVVGCEVARHFGLNASRFAHVLHPLCIAGYSMLMPWAAQLRLSSGLIAAAASWLSTRSYCLYIVHLSLLQLAWQTQAISQVIAACVAMVATFIIAELSYHLLEMPISRIRPRQFRSEDSVVLCNPDIVPLHAR